MSPIEEVFGISIRPLKSYVEREAVDALFRRALNAEKHIAIYGSSKQGKTALRQRHLSSQQCISVHCSIDCPVEDIYATIARGVGAVVDITHTNLAELRSPAETSWFWRAVLSWRSSAEDPAQRASHTSAYNLSNAQSVAELLRRANYAGYIVIENFHYLSEATKKRLALDLKTFNELGIRFIILGVWKQVNFLQFYNQDLQDRVASISVEPWEEEDFIRVANKGFEELNATISPEILTLFIQNSFGNIGLFQEFLRMFCELSNLSETSISRPDLSSMENARRVVASKHSEHEAELVRVLQAIAASSAPNQSSSSFFLPYYLAITLPTFSVAAWRAGIPRNELLEAIRKVHHRPDKTSIAMDHLTVLLGKLKDLQKDMQSQFVYYEPTSKRIFLIDNRFLFAFAHATPSAIASEIPSPLVSP